MSIVGTGDLASVLFGVDDPKRIYFAAGVSNSRNEEQIEFLRERRLLMDQPKDKHLVYFSSLSIYYTSSPYAKHKRRMEELIKTHFKVHTIIRLGNITWGTNPNTFINFFKNAIKNNEPFTVKDEYRYLIDKDEFLHWLGLIPDFSTEMNITGRRIKIIDVVSELMKYQVIE